MPTLMVLVLLLMPSFTILSVCVVAAEPECSCVDFTDWREDISAVFIGGGEVETK